MSTLRILCWGHRRAVDPFRAVQDTFKRVRPDIELDLDVRPLSDFEHQGIAGVAARYDLVVYDHPFSGDIAENELFVPLDEAFPDLLGGDADGRYVGGTLGSYRFAGRVWGAPIDAATQHAIYRPDLVSAIGGTVPASWPQALELGGRLRSGGLWLGIAVETPHALLTVGSLMANIGRPWTTDPSQPLTIDAESFLQSLELFKQLLGYCPPDVLDWNSIDLHEAMVARDDIVYCPCVYGYATYGEADVRRRLAFADFAGVVEPFHAGSAIGGTAVGLSRVSANREDALDLIRFLLSAETQDTIIPRHHGQPALLSSWTDRDNDERFNGFYSSVKKSMETVWVRPRHRGYITFQNEAGRVVAQGLRDHAAATDIVDAVLKHAERVPTEEGRT